MKQTKQKPSEIIEAFLDFLEQSKSSYQTAYDVVGDADERLQDLLHELEFAKNKSEKGKAATKLKSSRNARRVNKDIVTEFKDIVEFYNDQGNRPFIKKLKELVRKQKFTESYLDGERVYKPRKDATNGNPNR